MTPGILEVTHEDIPKILPLAEHFFQEAGLYGTFNETYFSLAMSTLMATGEGIAFALDNYKGAIGGTIFTDPATSDRVAKEWFFYIHPQNRQGLLGMKLFKTFEQWALNSGAKRIFTGCLLSRRLHRLYARMGYTHAEELFVKTI